MGDWPDPGCLPIEFELPRLHREPGRRRDRRRQERARTGGPRLARLRVRLATVLVGTRRRRPA